MGKAERVEKQGEGGKKEIDKISEEAKERWMANLSRSVKPELV